MHSKSRNKPNTKSTVDIKLVSSKPLRYLLLTLSSISLILGLIGAVLPLIPTTPFLLLSAALFARSSPKFYYWLIEHKVLGPPLLAWRQKGVISPKAKILAVTTLILSLGTSIVFFVPLLPVQVGLTIFGLCLIGFIITRPNH